MIKVNVTATYYTNTPNGKLRTTVDFEKEIPDMPDNMIMSNVQSRLMAHWIADMREENAKKEGEEKLPICDGVESCKVYKWTRNKKDDGLLDRNILGMSEYELQLVASKFKLWSVPKPFEIDLQTLRNVTALAYVELKNTIKNGEKFSFRGNEGKYSFFKKGLSGAYEVDFGRKSVKIEDIGEKEAKPEEVKRINLEELL